MNKREGKQRGNAIYARRVEYGERSGERSRGGDASGCPADDNNMHPGKLHSRYFAERLNVAREIRLECDGGEEAWKRM